VRKFLCALVLALAASASAVAAASAGTPGPIQVSGQSAGTSQQSAAGSSATQTQPSNTNISIRVLSPGNDGDVTQVNGVGSSANAGNQSGTTQSSAQNASGAGAVQSAQQAAQTAQQAAALSAAQQTDPNNTNVGIRVLSDGNDGSVGQANFVGSSAQAGNGATTGQNATQSQSGAPCGCTGGGQPIQTADQSAGTEQGAIAASAAKQDDPSNTNVSIRVLSPGDGGDVKQANIAGSKSSAGNMATTTQGATQTAATTPCGCSAPPPPPPCGCSTTMAQQPDAGFSGADHSAPGDGSDGSDGTAQLNGAGSASTAGNGAGTTQQGTQGAGSGIQIAKQDAATHQGALAASFADQDGASNSASPVRVKSEGDDGSVKQANVVGSSANAGNTATTNQTGTQTGGGPGCGCGGSAIQILGQKADTTQLSAAFSAAVQHFGDERSPCGCGGSASGNSASPVRVYSPGDGGDVAQLNAVGSHASAGNTAGTTQTGTQSASGGGLQIQALGQEAGTLQAALAASFAGQAGASNDASPTRVYSDGSDGSVKQANLAGSSASAGNTASTTQGGTQTIGGTPWSPCGCGGLPIQVAGQQAWTGQLAKAFSAALQLWPANESAPKRVGSSGDGGSSWQANGDWSRGDSGNRAGTGQGVMQTS
jgi:hypothetical protein